MTALLPVVVRAQMLPPSAEPGRLEKRFEEQAKPQSLPEIKFPAPEQAPPPEQAGKVHFRLTGIVFEGNTVITSEALRPLYGHLLDSDLTLLDIYKLRDAITAKLRNDGYILSQALVPAQTVKSGVVRISIVEGAINSIRFEGDEVADRLGLIDRYTAKIKASQPLRAEDFERYVMLMNDLPGLRVKTVLQPTSGTMVGSDLVVVRERKPIDASFTIDNRGSRSSGPQQLQQSLDFNDLIGTFDQTSLRGIVTPHVDEMRYLDLAHTEVINSEGSAVLLGVRRSWTEPGHTLRPLQVKGVNSTVRFDFSHPLIRSQSETWRANVGFDYKNSRTNVLGTRLNEDRVRVLSLGTSYDISDALQGSNIFTLRYSQGLDIMNPTLSGSDALTRAGGRSDFRKFTFSALRMQPLPNNFGVSLGMDSQWSPDQLLSGEEFGVGGSQYGRPFDGSEITGDKGIAAKVELTYTPEVDIPNVQ